MGKMQFALDQDGKEILLKEGQYQVMMAWEKPYMEACVDAIQPSGDVLEVGFGLGYSATRIQHYRPKSHTIIECDPVVAAKAREWAKNYSGITIVEKTWQEAMPSLGQFDTIFFDDYPLEGAGQIEAVLKEARLAAPLVQEGMKRMKEEASKLPQLRAICYSDQDLQQFVQMIGKEEKERLPRFFIELFHNGQVSREQLERFVPGPLIADLETPKKTSGRSDRLFQFLLPCLEKHMHIDARFSCYLEDPTSKYEDPLFEEQIIMNPFLDYQEQWIEVDVPKHCKYYRGDKALVMTITKRG